MNLIVKKINEEIVVFEKVEAKEVKFDYVKMINILYIKEKVSLEFEDGISDEDKISITELLQKIQKHADIQ